MRGINVLTGDIYFKIGSRVSPSLSQSKFKLPGNILVRTSISQDAVISDEGTFYFPFPILREDGKDTISLQLFHRTGRVTRQLQTP